MDDDSKRSVLPYHSVGWVSMDLKNVKREPWMRVRNSTLSEDELMPRGQDRLKQGERENERGMKRRKTDDGRRLQNLPSMLHAPFPNNAHPGQRKVATLPGALTLAKSSSGLRRTIGRDLLPPLVNGLPVPAAKPLFSKRAKLFVPISPGMGRRDCDYFDESSSSSASPSSSDLTRGRPVRPYPLDANGDESLEEEFVERLRGESAMSYQVDSDEYARILQRRRTAPENISRQKDRNDDKSGSGGDSEDEFFDDEGPDDRPDFIPVDSSRLPRVKSIPSLPKPADVVLQSSSGSNRLWRNSPIILKRTYGNRGQNG